MIICCVGRREGAQKERERWQACSPALLYFPEFHYSTKGVLLELMSRANLSHVSYGAQACLPDSDGS